LKKSKSKYFRHPLTNDRQYTYILLYIYIYIYIYASIQCFGTGHRAAWSARSARVQTGALDNISSSEVTPDIISSSEVTPVVVQEAECDLEKDDSHPAGNPVFVVSRTKKRGGITIHLYKNGCYRRPGRELSSVSYTDTLEDEDLSLKCRDCFRETRAPREKPTFSALAADVEDSSGDESSSTDPGLDV
jgi:hypothetical protein